MRDPDAPGWHGHGHGHARRRDPRWHGREHDPRWHGRRFGKGAPLHLRIFRWFAASILMTGLLSMMVFKIIGPSGPARVASFAVAFGVLFLASLSVARRLTRPLYDLSRVTRDIGEGNLKSRARLRWHEPGEVGALAESINDMAARLEKQLGDQRELVAAVSHEIRAPLSRLRVLVELLRAHHVDESTLGKLDREIVEIDSLVGDLLASSRLDFSLLTFHPLDARAVAAEALERAGLPPETLSVLTRDTALDADPTLVARALANLLDNAERHAGGARELVVREGPPSGLRFEVLDRGPGIPEDALEKVFEPFQRGQAARRGGTSLGLGLALVRRIADAHGGRAWAENRVEGGARLVLELERHHPNN